MRSQPKPYGKGWQACVSLPDGKEKSLGLFAKGQKKVASQAMDDFYADRRRETSGGILLSQAAAQFLEPYGDMSRTGDHYYWKLKKACSVEVDGRALGDYPYSEIRRSHAQMMVRELVGMGHNAMGLKKFVAAMSALSSWAVELGLVEYNHFHTPSRMIRPYKEIVPAPMKTRAWTVEECSQFALASERPAHLLTYALGGLRLAEGFALRWEDIEWEDGLIRVRRQAYKGRIVEGTKSGAERFAPLSPVLARHLESLPRHISGFVFPTDKGTIWWSSNFRKQVWLPTREATGMDIRPHEMRHSWVSHLRAEGLDPADVAQMTGHTVETATRVYTHALNQSYEKARSVLG